MTYKLLIALSGIKELCLFIPPNKHIKFGTKVQVGQNFYAHEQDFSSIGEVCSKSNFL